MPKESAQMAQTKPTAPGGGAFGFTILGSGSAGNASVIHSPGGRILLDAGFTAKELCIRMEQKEIAPESISGILITHEHSDHVRGCRVFANKYDIPVYVTAPTCRELIRLNLLPEQRVLITPGNAFELCGIKVSPFSVTHDVQDPVAYTFEYADRKLGYATDLGFLSMLALTKLRGCDALVLESNYDKKKLLGSGRPPHLIRRIMSRQGHLSNDTACEALSELLETRTHQLVLAHLSRECNAPEIVSEKVSSALHELHRDDINVSIAVQDTPLDTVWIC